ncbi:uncharacterized protein F4822DRAFT_443440 [Hypoxylon trugodes]|uniref:uncharacterized protein n=1 Tax=Hypoxylon trugodes TaxID=326681 RepID=UPI002192919A|nr:uncharacterized protein F4822DRAFT_443440 [Hypoxylon trugodes]KAI1388505.1 hypothetical protein F4822DRAFT_443440 [Hypoxylon trugodes]
MSDYLGTFDFDAFSAPNEYTFDFSALDSTYPIGQEPQPSVVDFNQSLPPVATVATVEPTTVNPATAQGRFEYHPMTAQAPENSRSLKNKQHSPHASDHYPIQMLPPFACVECNKEFGTRQELNKHAETKQHRCCQCSCEALFARTDALDRHCSYFGKDNQDFPCRFCKNHRGSHSFRRRDHLVQHLRGYHKFDQEEVRKASPRERRGGTFQGCCPYPYCELHRDEELTFLQNPFQKPSEYSKHLKDFHKVTPFPCPVSECERTGPKGYISGKGLEKHLIQQHSEDTQSLARLREELQHTHRSCPTCGRNDMPLAEFNLHVRIFHRGQAHQTGLQEADI